MQDAVLAMVELPVGTSAWTALGEILRGLTVGLAVVVLLLAIAARYERK